MPTKWPGNQAVFALCEDRIKEFEGFCATPYRDSCNIPTIGHGTIRYPSGKTVTMKDAKVSKDFAAQCLEHEMTAKAQAIAGHLERMPSVHQAAAMLSLAYNIGVGGFLGSTVLRQFNAGKIPQAADAFLMWDKGRIDGKLVSIPGLLNRRKLERTLFLTAD